MAKGSFSCPVCDEEVPARAKACPHCGACEKSGWGDSSGDGLDLPDEEFDYDKFVADEFGGKRKVSGKQLMWKITAVVLIVLFIVTFLISVLWRS